MWNVTDFLIRWKTDTYAAKEEKCHKYDPVIILESMFNSLTTIYDFNFTKFELVNG